MQGPSFCFLRKVGILSGWVGLVGAWGSGVASPPGLKTGDELSRALGVQEELGMKKFTEDDLKCVNQTMQEYIDDVEAASKADPA